jgi:hypothetical protein
MANQVDLATMIHLREKLDQCAQAKKEIKTQYDPLESKGIEWMMQNGKRYIDKSNTGAGPFITLVKKTEPGSFNKDRYLEFFSLLLPVIRSGEVQTPEQCLAKVNEYLSRFTKRKLGLEQVDRQPPKYMDELREFLAGRGGH